MPAGHWVVEPRNNPPLERTAAAVDFTCGRASRVRRRGRSTALRYAAEVELRYRIYIAVTVVSLVLCVAAAVLWARSLYVSDWVVLIHRHAPMQTSGAGAATWNGLFSLQATLKGKSDYGDPRDTLFQYNRQPTGGPMVYPFDRSAARWVGFGGTWRSGHFLLIVPVWAIVLVSGAAAILSWWRARQVRKARRMGLCPACGYDLRASPDRCPECGVLPKPRPEAAA